MVSGQLTLQQQKLIAILPKISSPLSIFGSSFIFIESFLDFWGNNNTADDDVYNNNNNNTNTNGTRQRRRRGGGGGAATRKKNTTSIQRALMGLSVFDILFSWAWFMSTWMAPEWSDKVWAAGNQFTCNLQGYLTYVSIGVPLYSDVQAMLTLLLVRYNWTDDQFRRIEPFLHVFVWVFAFGSGAVVVAKGYFSADVPHVPFCANTDPPECYDVPEGEPLPEICGKWIIHTTVLFLVPLWISCLVALCCMASLYFFVRATRQRLLRYTVQPSRSLDSRSDSDPPRRDNRNFLSRSFDFSIRSRNDDIGATVDDSSHFVTILRAQQEISNRGILFILSFLFTWIWITIGLGISMAGGTPSFGIWACQAFLEPLQGFWNFLIFCYAGPKAGPNYGMVSYLSLHFVACSGAPKATKSPYITVVINIVTKVMLTRSRSRVMETGKNRHRRQFRNQCQVLPPRGKTDPKDPAAVQLSLPFTVRFKFYRIIRWLMPIQILQDC